MRRECDLPWAAIECGPQHTSSCMEISCNSSYIWIVNHSLCSFFHFGFFCLLRYRMIAKCYCNCESKEPNLTSYNSKNQGEREREKKKKKDNKNNWSLNGHDVEMINSQGKIGIHGKSVRSSLQIGLFVCWKWGRFNWKIITCNNLEVFLKGRLWWWALP